MSVSREVTGQGGGERGGAVLPSFLIPAFSFYFQPHLNLPLMGFVELLFFFSLSLFLIARNCLTYFTGMMDSVIV